MRHPSMCINKCMVSMQQLVHCPLGLPYKKYMSQVAVTGMKLSIPSEFPGYWWHFECNTYCVMVLGWLKKERRKKDEKL